MFDSIRSIAGTATVTEWKTFSGQDVRENHWRTGLYRVRGLSLNAEQTSASPESAILYPNAPNPFSSSTTLRYAIPKPMQIHLIVHDALGRVIQRFGNAGITAAGMHTVHFETAGMRPGVYFVTLVTRERQTTRTMLLLR